MGEWRRRILMGKPFSWPYSCYPTERERVPEEAKYLSDSSNWRRSRQSHETEIITKMHSEGEVPAFMVCRDDYRSFLTGEPKLGVISLQFIDGPTWSVSSSVDSANAWILRDSLSEFEAETCYWTARTAPREWSSSTSRRQQRSLSQTRTSSCTWATAFSSKKMALL